MGAKLYFYEQGASVQVVGSEAATSSTLLMKLKAGSNTFQYDASYWTDTSVLNEALGASSSDSDDVDVKMSAFNTLSISALTLCYKTLDNCYIYDLGGTYASARTLFSSGFIRSLNIGYGSGTAAEGKRAWTDLFLPPGTPTWYDDYWNGNGGGNCDMQRPGINTQCSDNNWARMGYCVNLPDQSCQPGDSNDADSPVGIGLKTQNWPNNVNAPFGEYFIYGAGSSGVQSFQHQAWLFAGTGSGASPTPFPTPFPTPSPTPSPTYPPGWPTPHPTFPPGGGVAATGDPHLQNVFGQRFDLKKPGNHVLINIPRGWHKNAMLRVEAEARQFGGLCADMYFQDLNITGAWVEATGTGGLRFQAEGGQQPDAKWHTFGKIQLKVAPGRTQGGLQYLNFYVKHLGHAGFAVGGLLGEDDHEEAAMPQGPCAHRVSLLALDQGA